MLILLLSLLAPEDLGPLLDDLVPGIQGTVQGRGRVTGPWTVWGEAEVPGQIPPTLFRGKVAIRGCSISLIDWTFRTAEGRIEADARAWCLGDGRFQVRIGRFSASVGHWRLSARSPLMMEFVDGVARAEGWVLESVPGEVHVEGVRSTEGGIQGTVFVPSLDLGKLLGLVGVVDPPSGTIRGEMDVTGTPGDLSVSGEVDLRDFVWEEIPGGSGTARFTWGRDGLALEDLRLEGAAGGEVQAWGKIGDDLRIVAEVRDLDLSAISGLLRDVRRLEGTVRGQVVATGTLRDPYVRGYLDISGGGGRFPRPFPAVEGARGRLDLGGKDHRISLRAELGGEEVAVEGKVTLEGLRPSAVEATLQGGNVLLADSRDLRARADLDLKLVAGKDGGLLSGYVQTRRLRYYRDFALGGEVVPAPEKAEGWIEKVGLDLHVKSKENLWIDNRETLSRYTLQGRVRGTIGKPLIEAALRCREGIYTDYGRKFRIESALLDFEGEDVANPRVDIAATTRISRTRIFLHVRGRLKSPIIDLASDPPFPKADIISLLSLGYTRAGAAEAGGFSVALTKVFDYATGFVGEIFRGRDRNFSAMDRVQVEGTPGAELESSGVKLIYRVSDRVSAEAERDPYGYYNVDLFYRFPF